MEAIYPTHLSVHSYYSFLRGLASPAELARAAAAFGMPSLALTDFNSLSGTVEFYDACRDVGVKPILGLEIDVTPPDGLPRLYLKAGRLTLLALGMPGWSNLCRLSSALLTDSAFESNPVFTFERMSEYSEGVLCLVGGWRSQGAAFSKDDRARAMTETLGQLVDIYRDRFYVGIEDPTLKPEPSHLAQRLNLPLVANPGIYYLDSAQAHLQRVVTAIRLNCRLDQVPVDEQVPPGASFLSPEEIAKRYAGFPQALAATQEIAGRCQVELPLGLPHYPEIPLPPGATAEQVLRQRAEDGAKDLYGTITLEIRSRLDHELDVIAECGYSALFLVMEEILKHARKIGVPYSSRGSAASSLVAHCLKITSPEPLRLNLYFERFLNPARLTPPDIDTDLCSRRRDEVIRFVYEHYGAERVAMVCTINRYRRRSALRDVAKAHGLPPAEINKLVEALPQRWYGPPPTGYQEGSAFEALSQRYPSERHQAIFHDAAALLDKPRHLSIHPGGVVIAPGRLTDLVPTLLASKGVVITQFDLDSIERLGLVKIDLLGIRGLTVLGDVAQALQAAQPEVYASSLDALDSIPLDDPPTSELVQHGRTIGCFQIESPGMRATLKEIQARTPDDLMIALALYRPGPLTGGLKDAFVRRHRGEEQAAQLHPALGPLLEDTYGVILYQEQVLRIAHELGGFSLIDADLLRRAMSHFDPGKQMQTLKEKFIAGALERGGVPPDLAERVWELMAAFAGYGFPKAHAASYAQVAWHSAWCKAHYPAVFMAAILANWGGYYGQRVYLTEARRLGLALRPPHVNYAGREFSVHDENRQSALYMGLDQVRDLTSRTIQRIESLRPFSSLEDFLRRADPRPIEVENLARAGALRGFGTIPELMRLLKGKSRHAGQLSLFVLDATGEDWTLQEKVAAQEAILGVGVDAHPLELVKDQIASAGAINTLEVLERVGQKVRVAGMRQTWRRFATARGDHIYYMSLEDLEGMLDVVISSAVYQRCRLALKESGPYFIEGVLERDTASGEPFIRAGNIEKIA